MGDQVRGFVLHAWRVAMFVAIVLLIHLRYEATLETGTQEVDVSELIQIFPNAASVSSADSDGSTLVMDEVGNELGHVVPTSPLSDDIIGFSGPTNTLIAFDTAGRICGLKILSSRDTRDHVQQVLDDPFFLQSLNGRTTEETLVAEGMDAVSGATLTSLAIKEGVIRRLGGKLSSLKFPEPPDLGDARQHFPTASLLERIREDAAAWRVFDSKQANLGSLLHTAPAADNIVGYQGPTESFIALSPEGKILGFSLGKSYDNLPYVDYVRTDKHFGHCFNNLSLEELSKLDLEKAGVEGVSGATMTSLAVAEGVVATANQTFQQSSTEWGVSTLVRSLTPHDFGSAVVIIGGIIVGMTSLRAKRQVRILFQLIVIGYLGLTVGNLLSQAMLVGWAQHGVPWKSAAGLAMLSIAALALPIFTKRNLYCTHLCPHGAVQQLLKRRSARQLRLTRAAKTLLQLMPVLLLAWCLIVGMTSLSFSLVDIEPFDAYVFQIAGAATIAVAIVGLVASLFIPMAYCKYGCPTGALLSYLRFNARSNHWTVRDWVATSYLLLALLLWTR